MSTVTSTPSPSSTPVLGSDTGRISSSKGRATPTGPSFGSVLAGARPILKGAEAVASVLPGGPLVAAAVKGPQALSSSTAIQKGGATPGAGVTIAPRAPASGSLAPSGGVAGQTPGVDPIAGGEGDGVQSVLADSQAFNMYYPELQEQISAENRQYSALSNVLKARHDTVKNAIGNIR